MNPFETLRVISRSEEPSKKDTADYLTLCEVGYVQNDFKKIYIQLSQDSENPKWHSLGNMSDTEILVRLIDILKR